MGKRQRKWAKRALAELIEKLGGKCVDCGTRDHLSIDHLYRRTWKHHAKDPSARVSIYRREARAGLVTVRCRSCNTRRGAPAEGPPENGQGSLPFAARDFGRSKPPQDARERGRA